MDRDVRILVCLLFIPAAVKAQPSRDVAPLKYWANPLHWQPSPTERATSPKIAAAFAGTPSASGLLFVAITPCRIVDTRAAFGFPSPFGAPSVSANTARTFPLQASTLCSIPSTALAYSINATAVPVGGAPLGFLTVWPFGITRPNTSTLNSPNGVVVANTAIVPAGSDASGSIQAFASNSTDLIIDINGYFIPDSFDPTIVLPFSGNYNGASASAFMVSNNFPGPATDPTLSYAAVVGNGGFTGSFTGTSAGNIGVQGLGGFGETSTISAPGIGGIGVFGEGGAGGQEDSGAGPGGQGGTGVYAVGGTSGAGFVGEAGGPGIQAFGGLGGPACSNNTALGQNCDMDLPSGGGPGGTGLVATGGRGGPGGADGIGILAFPGTSGAGGAHNQYAGYFGGNLAVTGTLTKAAGSFRIDDPLDPANRYLSHSFVESPDMKNIYDGIAVLDVSGSAWVELPAWFEALNRDFRYQLTAIGNPAPGLFVAHEVSNNRFEISGGPAGLKVSWTVTGIRQDPYANAHRIPVEEEKPPQERGAYLHPELYGQPETRNVIYVEHPGLHAVQQPETPARKAFGSPSTE